MRNLNLSEKQSGGSGSKDLVGMKRGPWTPEEDQLLATCIQREGEGRWRTLPKRAGLLRCGKSCRLRWMNYLRPSVKRGHIAPDEEDLILRLHRLLGNRWSLIAGRIPGRTDNEIKNYWNTHLSKKLISQGIDPTNHRPLSSSISTTTPALAPAHHHHTTTTTTTTDNQYHAVASSSKSPDPLYNCYLTKTITTSHVSPVDQSDKNDQGYNYCYGGLDHLDNDQFDHLSTTVSKGKGILSNVVDVDDDDDDDAFLSSLVNYEQLFNQQEQHEPGDHRSGGGWD